MASEGWGVQQRVEARVGTGSVGAEVTRTGYPAPHTQCLIRGCSATALRAEILLSLLQRVAFQRRLVLVCAGDGAGGGGKCIGPVSLPVLHPVSVTRTLPPPPLPAGAGQAASGVQRARWAEGPLNSQETMVAFPKRKLVLFCSRTVGGALQGGASGPR